MIEESLMKEIKNIKSKIKTNDTPIAIQIPEGLKQYSTEILEHLKDYKPVLFVDPCFGACDLKDSEAKKLGCKLLIHFGHYKMDTPEIKTIFVPLNYLLKKENIEFIANVIKKQNLNKINLVTTIQYLENVNSIKKELANKGIETIECKQTNRTKPNMILGCDCSTISDQLHQIVFIGDGAFHANNIAIMHPDQEIIAISPLTKQVSHIRINEDFIRKRFGMIALARKATSFGILVSTKKGQNRIKLAITIKKILEKNKKKAYLLVSDYIKQDYLYGINVDCYINTACPRITYDDTSLFKKPMIAPAEIEIVLNKKLTEDIKLKIDQIT